MPESRNGEEKKRRSDYHVTPGMSPVPPEVKEAMREFQASKASAPSAGRVTGDGTGTEPVMDEGALPRPDLVSAFDVRKAIEETTAELERLRDPRTTWQLYLWDRLFPSEPTFHPEEEA